MSNPVDLEKMQEAYARACQRFAVAQGIMHGAVPIPDGAKYLAAEGFRLADAAPEATKDRAQRPLTYGQLRQQIEAEHPDDLRHYGAAKIARIEAEWKASHPWVRWASVISDAICASSSVPLHYKHAVRDAMDALPIAVLASDERQS
jgi:hypothetical protein